MTTPAPTYIRFTTHTSLRTRLLLSTLTGKPIHISSIRSTSTSPGLRPHEISLLRLLDTLTNGSRIEISYTGTSLTYVPGLITGSVGRGLGGDGDMLECRLGEENERGVAWFLEAVCLLAPFAKSAVNVRFTGPGVITSATTGGDLSVDSVRSGIVPLYDAFGIPNERVDIRVLGRSCAGKNGKGGGGSVEIRFGGQVRLPKTLHLNRNPGRIRRIRGVAYCTGVAASGNARMIHAARGILNPLVPGGDVNISSQYDQAPLVNAGDKNDPKRMRRMGIGFGIGLVAESSSKGVWYVADVVCPSEGGQTPEEIGKRAAWQLLESIEQGGCVGRVGMESVLVLMAMGSEDVGRVRLGRGVVGTEEFVGLGRDVRAFGGSAWGLRDVEGEGEGEDETADIIVSVKGMGVGNVGRKIG